MIQIVGNAIPSVPEDFQRRLQSFDPDLYVVWHQSPFVKQAGRWKIERCVRHHAGFDLSGRPLHTHICERVYILMCQDEEGTPKPLGDWVFAKLREMRANWEALGGDTERAVKNAIAISNNIDQEREAKREADTQEMIRYNRKDKRVQFNKLLHLISQHDMRPN
jgi:hypothetical protein